MELEIVVAGRRVPVPAVDRLDLHVPAGGVHGFLGPNGSGKTTTIRMVLGLIRADAGRIEVFGTDYPTPDGSCIRDYVHVHDLAPAHLAALAHLRGGGSSQILNCGYGRGYSVLDVVASVERVSGREIPIRSAPRRAGDPSALIADATKIGALLAWQPRFNDLDRIVGDTLAWERRLALV